MFPENVIEKIPEIEQDVSEFGKAFACEMAASCGMLLCRIFEVTLKKFGSHLKSKPNHIQKHKRQENKKQESEKQENQDDIIKEIKIKAINDVMQKLENDKKYEKLYNYLLIIRDEYRNKLMHGEINLKSMEEVIKIFHAVYNVLFLILQDMSKPKTEENV